MYKNRLKIVVFRLFNDFLIIMDFNSFIAVILYYIRTYVIFRGFFLFAKLYDY